MANQQRLRGPLNELHFAAHTGSTDRTRALLSIGRINIDQGDPTGWTPLMFAARGNRSDVARILLSSGASVSMPKNGGTTALHLSAINGHIAVTLVLIKAGADLHASDCHGATPLHLAAQLGHPGVLVALIEAGADVNTRSEDGRTPLFVAALNGRLDCVKALLSVKADPLLATSLLGQAASSTTPSMVPLHAAACEGHSDVVRELISQVKVEGCGGESGGANALAAAARNQHLETMVLLTDAGVVDAGTALSNASGCGQESAVKFLLEHRRMEDFPTTILADYVNFRDPSGFTPLFRTIDGSLDEEGVPNLISIKVARLLIDAGADATSAVRVTNGPGGDMYFNDTLLAFTINSLRTKRVGGARDARDEQMKRLEAIRRLLLRVQCMPSLGCG